MPDLKRILIASTRPEIGRLGTTAASGTTADTLLHDLAVLRKRKMWQMAVVTCLVVIAAIAPFILSSNNIGKAFFLLLQIVCLGSLIRLSVSFARAGILLKLLP